MTYKQNESEALIPVWEFSKEKEDKGFKIAMSVEEGKNGGKNHIKVEVTDNNTNITHTLPITKEVSWESGYQAELNIDKIYAAAHVEIENGLEYAEAALDIHSTFSGGVKTEKSKESSRLKLFETPVPLGSGYCGVDIRVYLVLSAEGEISLEAEVPMNVCVKYDKEKGLRREKTKPEGKNVSVKVDCEVDAMLRIEPILVSFLGKIAGSDKIMDMECDVGVAVKGEVNTRLTGMVCNDLLAAFPVFQVSVSGDDEIKTILGDSLGISAEWEIVEAEDAPFKKNIHVEIADGEVRTVDKCTYEEMKDGEAEPQQESTVVNTYTTQ